MDKSGSPILPRASRNAKMKALAEDCETRPSPLIAQYPFVVKIYLTTNIIDTDVTF